MNNILVEIMKAKREEVEAAQTKIPIEMLKSKIADSEPPRGFLQKIRAKHKKGEYALIAEIKKASPSKGVIRQEFDPVDLAKQYQEGGATCLSVLTDKKFFQGTHKFLSDARNAVAIPCLQKDFLVGGEGNQQTNEYQIFRARVTGADAVLVILAALNDSDAESLIQAAKELGMDALVEVHNEDEMERAINLNAELIGINNRDLKTFNTNLYVTEQLAPLAEAKTIVSESGINQHSDLIKLSRAGVNAFLVGESLMKQKNVTEATKKLITGSKR